MTKHLFAVLSMTFMLIINSGNAFAGTDIINGILLKAGNVIDKISLKYQEISLEIHKVLEGKMFSFDETTKNLIRNAIQDYESIRNYVEQVEATVEYAELTFEQSEELYDRISKRLDYVDERATELLKERGWKIGNSDDTDNEEYGENTDGNANDSTTERSGGALRSVTIQSDGTIRGNTGRGGDNNGNGRGSDNDDDNSSAGRTITRRPFSFGDDDSGNFSSNNNSSQNSAEPNLGILTERANGTE